MIKNTMAPKVGPKRAPNGPPPEAAEQSDLRKVLDQLGLLWCHVPNGELRDVVTAARLCSLGVKRGVPDILIATRPPKRPEARGVAIELKRRSGGSVSPDQRRWLHELTQEGWITTVCRGADEAVAFLASLGWSLPQHQGGAACSTK